jgi:hypothetical protein
MISKMASSSTYDQETGVRLWKSVIATTVQDWLSTSSRSKLDAERYLFQNSRDLSLVCELAGINVDHLRRCLNKVRGRTLPSLLPVATRAFKRIAEVRGSLAETVEGQKFTRQIMPRAPSADHVGG